MLNEKEYIEKVSFGDMKAFKEVFDHYYPGVRSFVLKLTRNNYHTEEITQNIFIRVWLKRELLDPAKNFSNYLYTIARHEVADYFRHESRFSPALALEIAENTSQTNEQLQSSFDLAQIEQTLDRLIEQMPPQRKAVFIMSRKEGLGSAEIARRLGLSKRTVERHINIALNLIKKEMGGFLLCILAFIMPS